MAEPTVFELIVSGKIPSNKVLENEEFLAFHDINPKAPIHILVIPKKLIKNYQECLPEIMTNMTKFIHEVVEILGLDKSGYRLITNIGEDSGQEIPHLHFHILGGRKLSVNNLDITDPRESF